MDNESPEPAPLDDNTAAVTIPTPAPELTSPATPVLSKAEGRHDGWSGDKMAKFCEVLAETAVVAEACDQAGMGASGAYALRRRNPVFAAAWDAALTIARERLADTLLARSMEGNIEQIWRDGELVGERHLLDNRLGLAILRRLDRLAETGATVSTRGERPPFPGAGRGPGQRETAASQRPGPSLRRGAFDWERMVNALRTGDPDEIAAALALLESNEVEEVEGPPDSISGEDQDPAPLDLSDRCWAQDEMGEKVWMTSFPPPAGFSGYENRSFDSDQHVEPYQRECTEAEAAILDADEAADADSARAEDEVLRDAWFAYLREELEAGRHPAEAEAGPEPRIESTGLGDPDHVPGAFFVASRPDVEFLDPEAAPDQPSGECGVGGG